MTEQDLKIVTDQYVQVSRELFAIRAILTDLTKALQKMNELMQEIADDQKNLP